MATLTTLVNGAALDVTPVNANFNALNTEARGVAAGGTGAATLSSNGVLIGKGTAAVTATSALTNGQLVIGSTSATPVAAALGVSNGLATTTGAGTLSLAPVRVIQWIGGI